jgi:2-methylcitrate dehydratase PrpD
MERLASCLLSLGSLPKRVEQVARICLLDTLGSGIYGATTPEGQRMAQAAAALSDANDALIWGTSQRCGTDQAAFVCGALCHVRELDDVHFAILHTGAVCVPAALAAAQRQACDLGQVLRAITLGVEAIVRVSLGMDYLSHRRRGWHATATCGAFGAAAAAASILGLDEQALADALGISGSRTGGSWAFSVDNAMSKRLHPGLAAKDGVLSAYLAARGITGPHYVLEAPDGGFYQAYSDSWDMEQLDRPRERYAIEDVEYKWFASCKSVHSPHSAALLIRDGHPELKPEDIRRVTVEVNSSAFSMASKMYEQDSVISAQLSIPYGIALGLYGRQGDAKDYEPAALADGRFFELAGKVRVLESEEMNRLRKAELKSGARLRVEWQNGRSAEAAVSAPKGSMTNPLSRDDIIKKFCGLTEHILGKSKTAAVTEMVLNGSAGSPVAELCALLRNQ